MAENSEVDGNGNSGDNETVKRSPFFKKPNGPIGYLTSLRSNTDSVSFEKRWVFLNSFDYGWGSQF